MSDLRTWWALYTFTARNIEEQPGKYLGLGRTEYGCGCRRDYNRVALCRYHEGMEKGADLQLIDESRRAR